MCISPRNGLLTLWMAAVLLPLVACETPPPAIAPGAEVTFDGLHRVSHSRMQNAWAKPELSLAGYDHILPGPTLLEYRAVRGTGGRSRTAFPLDDAQKARLERLVREEFRAELEKSRHFRLADQAAPNVLLLKSALADIVSHVSAEPMGRDKQWVAAVGEATLVLELRDSQSGEIFARVIDRRSAAPSVGAAPNSAVSNTAEVRTIARRWARTLRKRLDELAELGDQAMPAQ
jgi:hypothetical protein